jgi:hypothetical protein
MLRKTMIVLATAAALTGGLTADAFARGGGGHGGGRGGFVRNPVLAVPPVPRIPFENRIPAPLAAPAQAPIINGPMSQPAFRGLTGIGE